MFYLHFLLFIFTENEIKRPLFNFEMHFAIMI